MERTTPSSEDGDLLSRHAAGSYQDRKEADLGSSHTDVDDSPSHPKFGRGVLTIVEGNYPKYVVEATEISWLPDLRIEEDEEMLDRNIRGEIFFPLSSEPRRKWLISAGDRISEALGGRWPFVVLREDYILIHFSVEGSSEQVERTLRNFAEGVRNHLGLPSDLTFRVRILDGPPSDETTHVFRGGLRRV